MAHRYAGGCHCGNIAFEMTLAQPSGAYGPRACDCDFCRAHGASYVSDPHGKLGIRVRDRANLGRYRQGSGIAECLVCRNCGVLVAIAYEEQGRLYATVNSRAVARAPFGPQTAVSPKTLGDPERIARWKTSWFADVGIEEPDA